MLLFWVVVLSGLGFFLLRRIVTPNLERRWIATRSRDLIAKAGVVAIANTAATYLGVLFVVYAALLLIIAVLSAISPTMASATLIGLHEWLAGIKDSLETWKKGAGNVILVLALVALLVFAYRARRGGLVWLLRVEQSRQLDKILADLQADRRQYKIVLPLVADVLPRREQARAQLGELGKRNRERRYRSLWQHCFALDRRIIDTLKLEDQIDLTQLAVVGDDQSRRPNRWIAAIFSRGMFDTLEAGSKLAGRGVAVVAALLTVGVSASLAPGMATEPGLDRVSALLISRSEDEADAALRAAGAQSAALTPDEEPAYAFAASRILRSLSQPQVWVSPEPFEAGSAPEAEGRDAFRREAVRDAILTVYADGPEARLEVAAAPSQAADAPSNTRGRYQTVRESAEAEASARAPSDPAVDRLSRVLRKTAQGRPSLHEAIMRSYRQYKASWGEPMTVWSTSESLFGEALSHGVDQVWKGDGLEVDEPLDAAGRRLLKISLMKLTRRVEASGDFDGALETIGMTTPARWEPRFRPDEARAIRRVVQTARRDDKAILVRLGLSKPPTLAGGPTPNDRGVDGAFAGLPPQDGPDKDATATNFDGLMPNGPGDGAAAEPSGGKPKPPLSRDYAALEGYTHIGGVLIGRPPSRTDPTGVTDLQWSRSGRNLRLLLVTAGGRLDLGLFPGALVQQALAYAADGRVTAVTVSGGRFAPANRVQLHPALVNTELGCRMLQLDGLVFDGKPEPAGWTTWSSRVTAQLDLYDSAIDLLSGGPDADTWLRNQLRPPLTERGAAYMRKKGATAAEVHAWLFPAGWDPADERVSVFAHYPVRFDQRLVRRLKTCGAGQSEQDYWRCVAAGGSTRSLRQFGGLRSGVREVGYDLSVDSLRASFGKPDSGVAPLRFAYVVGFANPPDGKRCGGDTCAPWEFPMLKDQAQRAATSFASQADGGAEVMATARDFVRLQRLFRAALDGQLDPDFPAMRLAQLMAAAKRAEPISPRLTPTWDATRAEVLDRRGKLQSETASAMSILTRAGLSACAQRLHAPSADCDGVKKEVIEQIDTLRVRNRLADELLANPATRFRGDKTCPNLKRAS